MPFQNISFGKTQLKSQPISKIHHQCTWEVLTEDLDGSVSFCVSNLLVSFFQRISLQENPNRKKYEPILMSNENKSQLCENKFLIWKENFKSWLYSLLDYTKWQLVNFQFILLLLIENAENWSLYKYILSLVIMLNLDFNAKLTFKTLWNCS